ncbi:hypothetical protein CRENBAI_003469 [Crenichthys baileyi]|uniref:Uncharacterized protein n=1 Tax=Crenichthys baileyi TaxID=28760 RepID=A0AAV9RE70_9TELE
MKACCLDRADPVKGAVLIFYPTAPLSASGPFLSITTCAHKKGRCEVFLLCPCFLCTSNTLPDLQSFKAACGKLFASTA